MRAWIFVLAVLATFQTIVQVASTISSPAAPAMVVSAAASPSAASPAIGTASHTKSKHHHRRRTAWSTPTLSFAAIVAAPKLSDSDNSKFSLTNLNDIVINSDNVRHPPHRKSSSAEMLLVSADSTDSRADAVVPSNSYSNSVNSNLISSDIKKHMKSTAAASELHRRKHRKRGAKGRLRRWQRPAVHPTRRSASLENSVQDDEPVMVEKSSNELSVEEVEVEDEDDVAVDEEAEQDEEVVRRKPDPETLVAIEKNLLGLFGFTKRPSIDRSKVVIPEAMKRLYAETTGQELDLTNLPKPAYSASQASNTVRSFTHEESKIDRRFLHHHRFRLHFNTSTIPKEEHLKAAELVLSRDAVPDADRIRHRVQLYDIVRPGIKGKREPILLLIDTKVVKVNTTDNLILDVMPAMERWQREPTHNHGLLVHVSTVRGRRRRTHDGGSSKSSSESHSAEGEQPLVVDGPVHHHVRLRRSAAEPEETWAKKQPLLFAYTDDKRHRTTRAVREGHHGGAGGGRLRKGMKKKPRGICQRHALWVDFEDVGWNDWIVAPRGYDAYYCKGECRIPMADHMNATNHAVVQTLVNSINSKLAPRACCVPTSLTSISLLYLDDQNKVVLKKYQEMAVTGCGCR